MANVTLNSKIQLRNDTASNWTSANSVLLKGEMGIEIDTLKYKIGDGSTSYNDLEYASGSAVVESTTDPTTSDSGYDIGTLWLNASSGSIYILTSSDSVSWSKIITSTDIVTEAISAQKLKTARTISITGDATGSTSFDGSADKSITLTFKNSGATAGTYTKLTIDAKGIVTSATQITADDIPTIPSTKVSGLGTAATKDVGTAAGNVVEIGSDGKIVDSIIPSIAITEVYEVDSQTAMLALDAQMGDVAIRSDENKSYILSQTPATTLDNWKVLRTPTDTVLSVNSKTGAVVLTTSDIAEGTNLYYTEARATANFNTNFASKDSSSLSDGDTILHSSDVLILNGGSSSN